MSPLQKKVARSFEFRFYAFEPQKKRARFLYRTHFNDGGRMDFTETLYFPALPKRLPEAKVLDRALEAAHLALGLSYYKLHCPRKVELPYDLHADQAAFWTTLYQKGLGELAYRNRLDPREFAEFKGRKGARVKTEFCERKDRCLLGIGGGKDSIVAGEWLKKEGKELNGFLLETGKRNGIPERVMEVMEIGGVRMERALDPKVVRGADGAMNGHVPISAIFAFVGFLTALLYDFKWVVVANEHSSNFGNILYKGMEVNHQWSKSAEFEALFQDYTQRFVSPGVRYFSAIRPFYELRIAEAFARMEKYHGVFSSCNRSFRITGGRPAGLWCGECPKCAFVFLLLSAFLRPIDLKRMFGKNLFEDENLIPLFKDLLGLGKMKPFDCVGTFEESRVAFHKARAAHGKALLFQRIKVPLEKADVFKTVPTATVPAPFRFMGMRNALILGYGREGKATEAFLKRVRPGLELGIADQSLDARYLEKQAAYDLVVKTPGLPLRKVTRPHTTASNLFFERAGGKWKVIGVTGSKGKSTTASLIYSILKTAGRPVTLLGNIGSPMLEALYGPPAKNTLFVLELSSYQLEDLDFAPDIAVVTSLFPEHMTHHGSLEAYYHAKSRIWRRQNPDQLFVYNPKHKTLKDWAKICPGTAKAYDSLLPMKRSDIPLLGEHNVDNVRAATTVARALGISDQKIAKAIMNFASLPHRLQNVGRFKGITFYDDAISTTPESTLMALKALKKVSTIFLGGEDRGYDFTELEKELRRLKVRNIVLFPDSGARMLKSNKGFTILKTRSLKAAVRFAYQKTQPGHVCLLSMASPSYSLWTNFEAKGDEFQKWVKELGR